MALDRSNGLWVVALSFVVAFVLTVISLPDYFPDTVSYARPEWVVLVLVYWTIAAPERIGITTGWCSGLVLDVLRGTLLGQHGLALIAVAYVAGSLYQQMRMFAIWQQGLIVFGITLLSQVINYLVESIAGTAQWNELYLLPSVVSALMWPWVFLGLRYLRRQFNVS